MIQLERGLCLEQALAAFDFGGQTAGALRFGAGHINDTFAVYTQQPGGSACRYILQRINGAVFPDIPGLMENVAGVIAHLKEKIRQAGGDPLRETMTLIPTKQGGWLYTAPDGGMWRSYRLVEHAISYQKAESPALFKAAARAFGVFTQMLADYPAHTLHETIPDFHNTRRRYQQLVKAVEQDRYNRAAECAQQIEFITRREQECSLLVELQQQGRLPLRVTHNDTKLNNVLIDPLSGEGVCVVDLDTVMPGLLVHDFGDAIRFGANTAPEDARTTGDVHFSLPLYAAYADGFLETAGPAMTCLEKQMMPYGAKIITLELAIRFLTDYLEGDVYFRPPVPGHNLRRCNNQLALVQGMEQVWEEMNTIIQQKTQGI